MTIIPFPLRRGTSGAAAPFSTPPVLLPSLPAPFTAAWQREHLPLIDAAMNLHSTDDVEFARRCRLMADADGRGLLAELSARLEQLAASINEVVQALKLTAARIRRTMATLPA